MTDLDSTFAALGDRTRRSILSRLHQGELGLSDLADPFEMSQTAVSKHVNVLRDAGLVVVEKRGRVRYCRLQSTGFQKAAQWLADYEDFWLTQVGSLADHLSENDQ